MAIGSVAAGRSIFDPALPRQDPPTPGHHYLGVEILHKDIEQAERHTSYGCIKYNLHVNSVVGNLRA